MANQARILLFNMNNDRQRYIERLCRSLSIKTSYIKPESYTQSIGYLAGIQGFQPTKASNTSSQPVTTFEKEMLVFSGMDSDTVDRFLESFKEAGLTPISLKAIITPHNIFWTPVNLYTELEKEHASFHI